MNVAISGSRTFTDSGLVRSVVERLLERGDFIIIGDAPSGVDAMAFDYLKGIYCPPDRWVRYVAHWTKFGRAAGHERNGRMIKTADMLVAIFAPGPATPGTSDAVEQAQRKGIPIYTYLGGAWVLSDPSGVVADRWLHDAEGRA